MRRTLTFDLSGRALPPMAPCCEALESSSLIGAESDRVLTEGSAAQPRRTQGMRMWIIDVDQRGGDTGSGPVRFDLQKHFRFSMHAHTTTRNKRVTRH